MSAGVLRPTVLDPAHMALQSPIISLPRARGKGTISCVGCISAVFMIT